MHFSKQISLISLAIAFAAASPAAQPNPRALGARSSSKDRFIDPTDPELSLDEQCIYREYPSEKWWNIVINDAKDFTDGQCGTGFLDNFHDRGCSESGWECKYSSDGKTMNAGFSTDTSCGNDDISSAINAAFGGKQVECANYVDDIKCGDDGKCDVNKD
ncbi:uncharacterized protein BDW47DRAFT_123073 [Aspergillus candidus]|uniref:Uncharacterized protein n=1 Tax=Aspergillus candidus TaxID=41067 RepID=A0A2I2FK58_ASPCN|nr:hypothetical protein BDW47DRAFT_123073 [Aspergillus candidus]PLB41011.1 hypothetical protein BDW47DRAFT_123073 [Aspergillus candidus]